MATISRLREREGMQKAVPVLVLFEPARVLPADHSPQDKPVVALFFHPPTHPQIKKKKRRWQETNIRREQGTVSKHFNYLVQVNPPRR